MVERLSRNGLRPSLDRAALAAVLGRERRPSRRCAAPVARSSTCSTCSRTPPARASTSGTRRATRRPTSSLVTSACAGSTCCTRWAGTRSVCPPSSTRSPRGRTRATPPPKNIAIFRRQLKSLGFALRLVARGRHHRSQVRALDAMDLPEAVRARAGVSGGNAGELVPGARHGAGQRRGDRRPKRARQLPGHSPAAAPVAAPHHARTPSSSPPSSMALDWPETRQKQRDWIGSQRGRRGRLSTHRPRRVADACSPRGRTRCTARPTW